MEPRSEVVVVGAGIIGCAIARELARRGLQVRVLEARRAAAGATQASAGMLAPFIEGHDGTPFMQLAVRSLSLYDDFVAGVERDAGQAIEYRRNGSLQVAFDDAGAAALARSCEGDGPGIWIDGAAAGEMEPRLARGARGAVLVDTHGYVGVEQLTAGLAAAAARHGAVIESGIRVTAIAPAGAGLTVHTADGRAWPAQRVVMAAGSWSAELCPDDPAVKDVAPVRGQLLRLHAEAGVISRVLWGPSCYLVPWSNGTILVGATEERAGFQELATALGVRTLLEAALTLVPSLDAASFLGVRAGLRPWSPDGLPIIGPSPSVPGLVHATGHFRNGVLLAPLTAAMVGDLIADGREDPALAITRPDRLTAAPGQ